MPARDIYHPHVIDALIRDGWRITHDPLTLRIGAKDLFVDIGAERFLGAEKGGRRIAVEVKSFVGSSEVRELEVAIGQFSLSFTATRWRSWSRIARCTWPCASRSSKVSSRSRWGRCSSRTGDFGSWSSTPTAER